MEFVLVGLQMNFLNISNFLYKKYLSNVLKNIINFRDFFIILTLTLILIRKQIDNIKFIVN